MTLSRGVAELNNHGPEDLADDNSVQEKPKVLDGGRMYSAGEVRIAVIDDDPAVGRLVQATLAGHDFTIDIISDPHKVEPALRRQQYHVVILDYVLPGLESGNVLNLVQESQPDTCVIVVTAFPSIDMPCSVCGPIRTIT